MKPLMVCLAMLTLGWVAPRMAAAECCNHCGCQCQCRKVCRLVPDVKKVPKVRYECECEDFCVPGKSCIIGYDRPDDDDCDHRLFKPAEPIWQPSCGCVRTRHKLVKIETFKEVKTYKCVVVNLCPHCCALNAKGQLPASNIAENQPTAPVAAEVAEVAETPSERPSRPASKYSQYEEGAESAAAAEAKTAPPAQQPESSDTQLVSHEAASPPPSLIGRFKRSVLGIKAPEKNKTPDNNSE